MPSDGDAARVKFGVEVFVRLVQGDSSQRGKLIDVQHVAAVHMPGLHKQKSQYTLQKDGAERVYFHIICPQNEKLK